jgi:hypothetical protein
VARFRPSRKDSLARELRASRPELPADFVDGLAKRVDASSRSSRLYAWSKVSFAAALTVVVLGAFASFGGLGYAASGTQQAVKAVKHVVAPSRPQIVNKSAAQAQYGQPKVTICHKGHTITIAEPALPAHLRHGDTVGACGVAPAGTTGTTAGVLGTTATEGKLPFTGVGLGVTVLIALLLVSLGLVLRRRADEKS